MARDRTIPSDFWTWEAVIDCPPMTRLLFIGLWNFADDFGVQPLRPRTIRMQVFPGDTIENDSVRAMIDELAARGLVRIYAIDGIEYVAVLDWEQIQRVGKRARRRYPAFPCPLANGENVTGVSAVDEGLRDAPTDPNHRKPSQCPAGDLGPPATPPAWPSALAPPSTPADAPGLHR